MPLPNQHPDDYDAPSDTGGLPRWASGSSPAGAWAPPEAKRPPAPAEQMLLDAAKLVGGDRARTHGNKKANMANIASLWNGYLNNRVPGTQLQPHEVADLMELMKVARRQSGSFNPDDYMDAAGYAGVALEVRGS